MLQVKYHDLFAMTTSLKNAQRYDILEGMIEIGSDETLDEIRGVRIIQKKKGYRFSVDALLLADFPDLTDVKKAVDLGTGSGIIAILLAMRSEGITVTGIELQSSLYYLAVRNMELADLSGRIEIVQADIRHLRDEFEGESFDLVVSNPPYYQVGKGRTGPNTERTIARHEMAVTLKEVMDVSAFLLKNGGRVGVIYPVERREEVLSAMRSFGLCPKRIREVHTRDAQLIMAEGEKGYVGELKEEGPLLL